LVGDGNEKAQPIEGPGRREGRGKGLVNAVQSTTLPRPKQMNQDLMEIRIQIIIPAEWRI